MIDMDEQATPIRYRVVGELSYLDDESDEWGATHIDETVLVLPNEREEDEDQALRVAIDMVAMFIDASLTNTEFNGCYINLTAQAARETEQRKLAEWNAWAKGTL